MMSPYETIEFQLANGLKAKFRRLDAPEMADVRKTCSRNHSMVKSANIAAYTSVVTVEVECEEVHFIFWGLYSDNPSNPVRHFVKDTSKYTENFLSLANEIIYEGRCHGTKRTAGSILAAVMHKTSPNIFALIDERQPSTKP